MRDDHRDGTFLLLGNGLGLYARLNLAIKDILYEVSNVLMGKLLGLIKGELGVLSDILDGERWEFPLVKVKVSGMSTESLGINSREIDDALVLLCNGFESFGEFSTFLGSFGEDVR